MTRSRSRIGISNEKADLMVDPTNSHSEDRDPNFAETVEIWETLGITNHPKYQPPAKPYFWQLPWFRATPSLTTKSAPGDAQEEAQERMRAAKDSDREASKAVLLKSTEVCVHFLRDSNQLRTKPPRRRR